MFFHTYIIEKYFKDKFTISSFFSVHVHRNHANMRRHGCLVAKWSGQSELIYAYSLWHRYGSTLCLEIKFFIDLRTTCMYLYVVCMFVVMIHASLAYVQLFCKFSFLTFPFNVLSLYVCLLYLYSYLCNSV